MKSRTSKVDVSQKLTHVTSGSLVSCCSSLCDVRLLSVNVYYLSISREYLFGFVSIWLRAYLVWVRLVVCYPVCTSLFNTPSLSRLVWLYDTRSVRGYSILSLSLFLRGRRLLGPGRGSNRFPLSRRGCSGSSPASWNCNSPECLGGTLCVSLWSVSPSCTNLFKYLMKGGCALESQSFVIDAPIAMILIGA